MTKHKLMACIIYEVKHPVLFNLILHKYFSYLILIRLEVKLLLLMIFVKFLLENPLKVL